MKKSEPSLDQQTIVRVLACILVLAVVALWFNIGSSRPNTQSQLQTTDWVVDGGPILGCKSVDDLVRVESLFAAGDNFAGIRAKHQALGDGVCVEISNGEKLVVEQVGSANVVARRPGDTVAYWVSSRHLK